MGTSFSRATKLSVLSLMLMLGACQTSRRNAEGGQSARAARAAKVKAAVQVSYDPHSLFPAAVDKKTAAEAIKTLLAKLKEQARDVHSVDTKVSLAALYLLTDQPDRAKVMAEAAVQDDFRHRGAKLLLAQVYYRQANTQGARIVLNELGGALAPEPEVLNLLALAKLRDGDEMEARDMLAKAAKRFPNSSALRLNYGLLALRHNLIAIAQTEFQAVLKTNPDNLPAKLHLAITYAVQDKFEEAEDLYASVKSKARDQALVLFDMAIMYRRAERYDDAIASLNAFLKRKSKNLDENELAVNQIAAIRIEKAASSKMSDEEIREMAEESLSKQNKGNKSNKPDDDDDPLEDPGPIATGVGTIESH